MALLGVRGLRPDLCGLIFIFVDDASGVSQQMANWLKNASTVSAPNPYQRQIFRGGKTKAVRSSS